MKRNGVCPGGSLGARVKSPFLDEETRRAGLVRSSGSQALKDDHVHSPPGGRTSSPGGALRDWRRPVAQLPSMCRLADYTRAEAAPLLSFLWLFTVPLSPL